METFWFFRLRFRRAYENIKHYDSSYDSDFRFSLGHRPSYDSDCDSDSDTVASENQPLEDTNKENWMTMFIQFFFVCPLSLTIKLNFNLSKVAYYNEWHVRFIDFVSWT